MRSARLSNDDISRIFSAASQPFSQSVAGWNYSDVAVVGEFRLFSVGYIAARKTSRGFFSVAFIWWACAAFEIICAWSFGVVWEKFFCEVSARLG